MTAENILTVPTLLSEGVSIPEAYQELIIKERARSREYPTLYSPEYLQETVGGGYLAKMLEKNPEAVSLFLSPKDWASDLPVWLATAAGANFAIDLNLLQNGLMRLGFPYWNHSNYALPEYFDFIINNAWWLLGGDIQGSTVAFYSKSRENFLKLIESSVHLGKEVARLAPEYEEAVKGTVHWDIFCTMLNLCQRSLEAEAWGQTDNLKKIFPEPVVGTLPNRPKGPEYYLEPDRGYPCIQRVDTLYFGKIAFYLTAKRVPSTELDGEVAAHNYSVSQRSYD